MTSLYEFTASLPSAAAATVNPAGPIHSYDTDTPCPACGVPNGTCTGEHHMAEKPEKTEPETEPEADTAPEAKAETKRSRSAPAEKPGEHAPNQSTLAFGGVVNQPENTLAEGGVKIKTKAIEGSDLVEVTEDVLQEFYALGAKRPSKRLIAAKGSILTKAQVESLKS